MSALYLFNIVPEVLARAIRQLKEMKGIETGKEEIKILLFTDGMHKYSIHRVYINNPKNSTRELLQPIKTFREVAGSKIN